MCACDVLAAYLSTIGRPRHGLKDSIKMDLKIGLTDVDWTHVAEVRDNCWMFVNTVMEVPRITSNFLTS